MNYHPKQLYMWDGWCMVKDGQAHLYHLQRNRKDSTLPEHVQDMLGHAVSKNLVDWEECPPCFGPDPSNPHDNDQPWTGCTLWHQGRGYLYYTMRRKPPEMNIQSIGLATSDDGYQWIRHPKNPVIVPDPTWYATPGNPDPRLLDCRDLLVIANPNGQGWLGFYATRQPADVLAKTSVIACVKSEDLIHWTHLPPAYVPNKYACVEVPDVFEIDGLWYMTCLTGTVYGNRGIFGEPHLNKGTIYAVADRPEGPYRELSDFVLFASQTRVSPISCRSLMFQDRRYILYTDRETEGRTDKTGPFLGVISTPKEVRTSGTRLYLGYSDRIETHVEQELIGPSAPPKPAPDRFWGQIWFVPSAQWHFDDAIRGQGDLGWGVLELDYPGKETGIESFIFEADLTLKSATAAGLVIRMGDRDGLFVGFDRQMGSIVVAGLPVAEFMEHRKYAIPTHQKIHLKIVQRREFIEVYAENELKLTFARYLNMKGSLALMVDRGEAIFENIRLRTLRL